MRTLVFWLTVALACSPLAGQGKDQTSAKIEALRSSLLELKYQMWLMEEKSREIDLDLTDLKGYQKIKTNFVDLLITLKHVEPYLDGLKVTIMVGNFHNVTFLGCKINAKWGPKKPSGIDGYSAWEKSLKSNTIALPDKIFGGRWNDMTFIISPATPSSTGHLSISMEMDGVALI